MPDELRDLENKNGVTYNATKKTIFFAEDWAGLKSWLAWIVTQLSSITTSFLALTDTPDTYSGQAGKTVKVNSTEDGLVFADGGGSTLLTKLVTSSALANVTVEFTAKKHLKVFFLAKTSTSGKLGGGFLYRFNSDSGSNYRSVVVQGTASSGYNNASAGHLVGSGLNAPAVTSCSLDISNTASENKIVSTIASADNGSSYICCVGQTYWYNMTDQISSVTFIVDGTITFPSGTQVLVYGED